MNRIYHELNNIDKSVFDLQEPLQYNFITALNDLLEDIKCPNVLCYANFSECSADKPVFMDLENLHIDTIRKAIVKLNDQERYIEEGVYEEPPIDQGRVEEIAKDLFESKQSTHYDEKWYCGYMFAINYTPILLRSDFGQRVYNWRKN